MSCPKCGKDTLVNVSREGGPPEFHCYECDYHGDGGNAMPTADKMKCYRIIAVANTEFWGEDPEDAKVNFINQAETLDRDDWTFILVEEIRNANCR